MKELKEGDVITYARQDAGVGIGPPENRLRLVRGNPYTVGTDISLEFATRLVRSGVCRIEEQPKPEKAAKSALTDSNAKNTPNEVSN